jgi:hypothetical protein
MADNVEITKGSGTVIAADEPTSGVAKETKVQRVKPMTGKDGEAVDVSSENPMPVGGSALGTVGEAEASGEGGIIGILKRLRTLLEGAGFLSLVPRTSGGLSKTGFVSAASTNATLVKGAAGQVYGWSLSNEEANWVYLKLYNASEAPTPGTTPQFLVIGIPPGGSVSAHQPMGIAFSTGIGLALTKGAANASVEAVTANKVVVTLFWK